MNTLNETVRKLKTMSIRHRGVGLAYPFAKLQVNYGVVSDKFTVGINFGAGSYKGQSLYNVESAVLNALDLAMAKGHRFVDSKGNDINTSILFF